MSIMTEGNHRVITVGIDLSKNVFAVHGVDDNGKSVLVKPKVSREHLLPLIAPLPPCVIGMEPCSAAHQRRSAFREPSVRYLVQPLNARTGFRKSITRGS